MSVDREDRISILFSSLFSSPRSHPSQNLGTVLLFFL